MTQYIVHLLETIKVETQYGKRFSTSPCHLDRAGEMLREGRAVRQICQGVVVRQMLDAGFCLLALGNILRKAQEIARLADLVGDREVLGCEDGFTIMTGVNRFFVFFWQVSLMRRLAATRKQAFSDLLV